MPGQTGCEASFGPVSVPIRIIGASPPTQRQEISMANLRNQAPPTHEAVSQWMDEGCWTPGNRGKAWAPATRRVAINTLNRFCDWLDSLDEPVDLLKVKRLHIEAWRDQALAAGRASTTVISQLRHLRGFYSWAAEEGPDGPELIDRDPTRAKGLLPRTGETRHSTLALDDADAMVKSCDRSTLAGSRDNAILLLLRWTGLRRSEIAALNLDDYNTGNPEKPFMAVGSVYAITKTGKVRYVPIAKPAAVAIGRYLLKRGRAAGPLFISHNSADGRLTASGISQVVDRARLRVGISRPVGVHEYRRAFVIDARKAGMSDNDLMLITGHSDIKMLALYAREADTELAHDAFFRLMDPGENSRSLRRSRQRRAS